jgi:tetratricopeptide (TPR) repeat protein
LATKNAVAVEGEALQLVVVDVVGEHLLLPPVDLLATLQGWHPGSSTIRGMAPSTVSPAGSTAPPRADPRLYPLVEALGLQDRVRTNPQETADGARALLARPRLGAEARTVAQRTLARSLRALDRPHDAVGEARRAAATARRAGLDQREAEARITLSLALFQAGRARVALEEIDRAEAVATGRTALLASAQHGTLLERLGRLEEALARYSAALAGELPDEDRLSVLNNRAIARSPTGRRRGGRPRRHRSGPEGRRGEPEAELIHNLGFVLTVAGDLPAALARFDEADARFMALGAPIGLNLVARARALLRANLHREARAAATWAVDAEDGAGGRGGRGAVLLATAELADDDPEAAIAKPSRPAALHRQGRPGLAAQAEHVVVRARVRLGRRDRRTVDLALRCADALREPDWWLRSSMPGSRPR